MAESWGACFLFAGDHSDNTVTNPYLRVGRTPFRDKYGHKFNKDVTRWSRRPWVPHPPSVGTKSRSPESIFRTQASIIFARSSNKFIRNASKHKSTYLPDLVSNHASPVNNIKTDPEMG